MDAKLLQEHRHALRLENLGAVGGFCGGVGEEEEAGDVDAVMCSEEQDLREPLPDAVRAEAVDED